ncbi:MAG: hypothetical protein IJM35_08450 [Bacteroidales bacterium]|nr:hypothetical protein [Bacteroidales bacterium]
MSTGKKIIGWLSFILVLALAAFIYIRFYYVFSDGYKTGELNQISHKGYVFKTYEGVIILTGYGKSGTSSQAVQSKEFVFSVKDKEVAEQLSGMTGMRVTVHYKKYLGALPWRGYQASIVDSVAVEENYDNHQPAPDNSLFL